MTNLPVSGVAWLGLLCGLVLLPGPLSAPQEASAGELKPVSYYEQLYEHYYQENRTELDQYMRSGGHVAANGYYRAQYVLMGTLALYEATGNEKYLRRALNWGTSMVDAATISDSKGFLHWPGQNDQYGVKNVMHLLGDAQGTTELARMARIVLINDQLKSKYGTQANKIYQHVRENFAEMRWEEVKLWRNKGCTEKGEEWFSDKPMMIGRILKNLWLIDGNNKYGDMAKGIAACFKDRFEPYRHNGIIWDLDGERFRYLRMPIDTEHGNRAPEMVIDFAESGMVFGGSHITGLANLFSKVIWNGSVSSPDFAVYINGSPSSAGDGSAREPMVSRGWAWLASYDCRVYEAQDALLTAIEAGRKTPIIPRNNNIWSYPALTGNLARAAAMECSGKPTPVMTGASGETASRYCHLYSEVAMTAKCTSSSATLELGNDSNLQYIYDQGYEWRNSRWSPITYSGSQKTGVWIIGKGTATVSRTSTDMSNDNYFTAYLCIWTGSQWKCDWQLQAFRG